MPFIGNKPSAVPLTSADIADGIITSAKIVDGTIVNADINASAAIASTKLSGVTSDYVLLATTDASASASVSFDGYFSSTYKNYQFICSGIQLSTNNTPLRFRFRRSNADVTASNYIRSGSWDAIDTTPTSNYTGVSAYNADHIQLQTVSNSTLANAMSGKLTLFNPLSTDVYKIIESKFYSKDGTANWSVANQGATLIDSTSALSGVSFYVSAGNITVGNFKLYGIK